MFAERRAQSLAFELAPHLQLSFSHANRPAMSDTLYLFDGKNAIIITGSAPIVVGRGSYGIDSADKTVSRKHLEVSALTSSSIRVKACGLNAITIIRVHASKGKEEVILKVGSALESSELKIGD